MMGIALLMVGLAGISTEVTSDGKALLAPPQRILFLGDSITYDGRYIAYFEGWLRRQMPDAAFEVINAGLSSETVSGLSEEGHAGGRFPRPVLRERLARVLDAIKPEMVIACYGMNCGIYQAFDPERFRLYQEGITQLHDAVTASGAAMVFVTPPYFDESHGTAASGYNEEVLGAYRSWLISKREDDWHVIDLHGPMMHEVQERRKNEAGFTFQPDGIHPGDEGHRFLTQQLIHYFGGTEEGDTALPLEDALFSPLMERMRVLRDAWLTRTGHQRPELPEGLPLEAAQAKAAELDREIVRYFQGGKEVHAFYYSWYGNPETDGHWSHWNHQVLLREGGGANYTPPEDIGASFYPADGLYSSNNPEDVARHIRQMKAAGIDVVALTWWGADHYTDKPVPIVFDAAAKEGLKVCFHIEPFPGRNAKTTRQVIVDLTDRFGGHPAWYRGADGRPLFYLYDSYLTPAREWAEVLSPEGAKTLRNTPYDATVIGLWVKRNDGNFMKEGGFDGFYTYFATDGFTYGSTPANWPQMARWAKDHGQIFIPCVGPGYEDLRVRPWNTENVRERENGAYYDRMFDAAIGVAPDIIGITSFNEWHEGTQIEAAVPKRIPGYTYLDYESREPEWYLERTRYWAERWRSSAVPKK